VLLDDPAKVGLVLGPLAPVDEARAALEAGKAVVLQPGSVSAHGHVEVRLMHTDSSGTLVSSGIASLPAVEVPTGALPADIIIGPKLLAPGSPLASGAAADGPTLLLVRPAEPDAPDRPTTGDRIQLAATKAGLDLTFAPQQTETDPGIVILAVGAVATFLLALLAGLMVTTLALADGHADAVTLAAVGGPPGLRRRMAGASAGFVAALGCVAGAAAGLAAARVLVPLTTVSGSAPFVTPWAMLGLIVVGVPLLTMAVAWLTTRSHVTMTRRADG
jgi:putative ABC transport system permease protein